jgi:hypothetical protein
MKKEEKNRLLSVLKNYNNMSVLIGDLLNPISKVMESYQCSEDEAVNIKLRAEEYLRNYGCMTIDATTKAVKNIVENIKVEEEIETPVPTDAR